MSFHYHDCVLASGDFGQGFSITFSAAAALSSVLSEITAECNNDGAMITNVGMRRRLNNVISN